MKPLKYSAIILLLLIGAVYIGLRSIYGGGSYYPDLSTEPLLPADSLEAYFSYPEPLGNIAVSADNRVFFTVHPESRPDSHKVLEIVDGKAVPYPDTTAQQEYFQTVLGLFIDLHNRLWTIDHGNHGTGLVLVTAFDLATGDLVYNHQFSSEIAPVGSFFNDLQVSNDGRYVFIADVSFFAKDPALVVLDTHADTARRLLENHYSTRPQDYIIQAPSKDMTFLGGAVALKPGIDGLVLSTDGTTLYYGAMTHSTLYRVPTRLITNFDLTKQDITTIVDSVGQKPLSDGLSIDTLNRVYITDVEHRGLARMDPDGTLRTVIRHPEVRWADGASFGCDGYLYVTDSAIPDQMLRSESHMNHAAPYTIYRFKPDVPGIAGR